ncbi:MAG: ABC transporter permease [Clostridia bacterium]|nr:ABC transporter permease [Clostridia bacterium]
MKKNKSFCAYPYYVWMITFIVIPLLLVLWYALFKSENDSIVFTTEYIKRFFEPIYIQVFLRSIVLAVISTAICLVIGYPLAYILAGKTFKHKNMLMFLVIVPMWMNFLLRTYAWLTILEKNGILNQILRFLNLPTQNILYTNYAVILGMVYNYLPFMVLPLYTVLSKMDINLINAAEDLGANKLTVFKKVVFPLSLPGVVSGITMTFMPAVTTFVISKLLGGGQTTLIGDLIENQFKVANDWNFGSALSLILMVIILLSMRVMTKYEQENEGGGLF